MIKLLGLRRELGDKVSIPHRFEHEGEVIYSLTCLNDLARWSFKEIAAFLREHQAHFFIPLEAQ